MTLVCRNCSRINPPDASYCYWDGAALDGREHVRGPIAIGVQPFHSPFVFPSGRPCRNFDELLLACYDEWNEARELLREGYLESFFGAMGRADLALAAKQAMRAADPERGLDQLLSKLPCTNREPPRLFVQPMEINLGILSRSSDRHIVLNIENQGMGLLQGTASCEETAWLMLGEGVAAPRKVFQCLHEFKLPVQIHGKALRAGNKSWEGRLTIDSNGGPAVIVVRVEVPVQPFPESVLTGAVSPRQIAEKAKANPKAAAPFFEKGAVAAWYESNGWTYPVQGPASSGLGAIQQFFEALGLVKAPVVEISETAVLLQGAPGARVEYVLRVRAQEKRPVFAHATTGAPWLQIGRIVLEGQSARIPLKVPSVPARPGEQLQGKVQVTANGGQRFLVQVALTIAGQPAPMDHEDFRSVDLFSDAVLEAKPAPATEDAVSVVETVPEAASVTAEARAGAHVGQDNLREVPPVAESKGKRRQRHGEPNGAEMRKTPSGGFGKHLVPLACLALLLLMVVVHDLGVVFLQPDRNARADADALDPNPSIEIRFHDGPRDGDDDKERMPEPSMRFGLVMLGEKDPLHPDRLKKLTFDEWGRSNNTVLRVDGREYLFGEPNSPGFSFDVRDPPGEWVEMKSKLQGETAGRPRNGLASSWLLPGRKIQATQEVEIVPGVQSRRLDTCLVRYTLDNRDTRPHGVGIRFMLDTFIGANDGVPFTIPGASGLCDTKAAFNGPEQVPDFIEALEKDDLRDPGTVAYLQFRLGGNVESPSRVLLGGWPNADLRKTGVRAARAQLTGWNVPFISIKERLTVEDKETGAKQIVPANDSAVTMYWSEQPLAPGQTRVVGFTYGLGNVDTRESSGHLLLTVGGRLVHHGEFTLTALVHDPQAGERLTLDVPPGFSIVEGEQEQTVPPVPPGASRLASPVTWRLRAGDDGTYELSVQSTTGAKQKLPVTIRTRGVFD
jgi:hypothetical protein